MPSTYDKDAFCWLIIDEDRHGIAYRVFKKEENARKMFYLMLLRHCTKEEAQKISKQDAWKQDEYKIILKEIPFDDWYIEEHRYKE